MAGLSIRVKYSSAVEGHGSHWPAGFYIWFKGSLNWEAVERLRFTRQKDAQLAERALIAAGISTKRKMVVNWDRAVEIAFTALQW